MSHTTHRFIIFITLLLTSISCFSSSKSSPGKVAPGKVIAGWVEYVSVEGKAAHVKAKLDTGALTSSIHATDIKQLKKSGKRWVRFTLHYHDKAGKPKTVTLEKPKVRGVQIKARDDEYERRSVVKLKVCLDGRIHETQFTLANRSNYLYPILLGRRLLNGIAVIDPDEKYLTRSRCPKIDKES